MKFLNDSHLFTCYLKRVVDIIASTIGILLILPIMPFIAIAIKIGSTGPVLFSQQRIGLATPHVTKLFNMYKFRTMNVNAEKTTGAVWATKDDPRITYIGKFLRKTRLDEIPQLFNVLKGEMSLIGPRPERPGFYQKLEQQIPFFAERTYGITPGITGLAQINQGYDTNIEDVRRKVGFDHRYALALSNPIDWLKMDLSIAFKTIWVMITGRGQ